MRLEMGNEPEIHLQFMAIARSRKMMIKLWMQWGTLFSSMFSQTPNWLVVWNHGI
jgi:hypothetical protein